jgi:hypothetical protein
MTTTTPSSKVVPTCRRSWETLFGYTAKTLGPFTEEIMVEADRISNGIWNTLIRRYHEVVSDNLYSSLLIYHTIYHQSAIKITEVFEDTHYIEQVATVYEVCQWESCADDALEFFYIDSEIEEYLDDETDYESVRLAVWFDLGMSCLHEIVSHLLQIREDLETPSGQETYSHILSAYQELGVIALEMLDHYAPGRMDGES